MPLSPNLSHWPTNEFPYGWAGCYVMPVYRIPWDQAEAMMTDVTAWIKKSITNCESNCHWAHITGDHLYFRFRKSDDMLAFALSWPAKKYDNI